MDHLSQVIKYAKTKLPRFTDDDADDLLELLAAEGDDRIMAILEAVLVGRDLVRELLRITALPRGDYDGLERVTRLAANLESALADLSPVTKARLESVLHVQAPGHEGSPFGVEGMLSSGTQINDYLIALEEAAGEAASWRDGPEKMRQDIRPRSRRWKWRSRLIDPPGDGGQLSEPTVVRAWYVPQIADVFVTYNWKPDSDAPAHRRDQFVSRILDTIIPPIAPSVGTSVKTVQADLRRVAESGEEPPINRRLRRERAARLIGNWLES